MRPIDLPRLALSFALLVGANQTAWFPAAVTGQEFESLVERCGGPSGTLRAQCHAAAVAMEAARGGLGTAAAFGSETPGAASTFGYRLQGFPRYALSARAGLTRFSMADLPEEYGLFTGTGEEGLLVPSVHISGTIGVLNGFSPSPTVGGVLSMDLTLSGHGLFPPGDRGFQGKLWGWGVGARLGILRESFTLPGVSLSLTRRWSGSAAIGDMNAGAPARAEFDSEVTSFRGVVGKDILGVGLLAGGGLDRLGGAGSIRARVSPTGFETMASDSDLSSTRSVFFAGGSMTFLILQVSGEVGFSRAVDQELPLVPGGNSSPSSLATFGSLAFRLTF